MTYKRNPLPKAHKSFRRILLCLMLIAFCFAGMMSYFYIGQRNGWIKHSDIAPTIFAADVYLYQVRAFWSEEFEKYQIAEELVRNGFFDRQYYYAGREMMNEMAENGFKPAISYRNTYFYLEE